MSDTATEVNERAAITQVVQRYIDGAKTGDSDEVSTAFYADATIFGYIGEDFFGGPIQRLFDWNTTNGPATELESEIAIIEVVGSVATARLELLNWTGHRFTDMFTLLKVDGQWKIVNKVFHLHR